MKTVKNVTDYTLFIKGLFGRNRTVKFESFKLAEDCETPKTIEEVRILAEQKLAALKPRGNYWFKVCQYQSELHNEDGYQWKSTRITLSDKDTLISDVRNAA